MAPVPIETDPAPPLFLVGEKLSTRSTIPKAAKTTNRYDTTCESHDCGADARCHGWGALGVFLVILLSGPSDSQVILASPRSQEALEDDFPLSQTELHSQWLWQIKNKSYEKQSKNRRQNKILASELLLSRKTNTYPRSKSGFRKCCNFLS